MNIRNGYCQMKKIVPRPNDDCANGVSPFPTWEPRALKSHAQGKKHQSMVLHVAKGNATLKDYLKKPEETEASTLKSQPSKPQEGMHWSETVSMSKFTLTQEQHKAEILWALKSVMSHFSYNSSQDIGDVFRAMFPDSKIAQQWSCGATKLSYLITFGIAPYFKELCLLS